MRRQICRSAGWSVLGLLAALAVAHAESLGPSSRLTDLVISEIMYHPAPRADGRDLEFVELFNAAEVAANLSGYRLSGAVDFTFPTNTLLAPRAFLCVARRPADVQAVHGLGPVVGGWTSSLPNDTGTVRLRNRSGAVLLEVGYADQPPWPAAADGAGHSLVLIRPSLGEADAAAWSASAFMGGSPGRAEPPVTDAFQSIVINEWLAHTSPPGGDFVELYNQSQTAVELSGCVLTDDPALAKFSVPARTIVAPRGFLAVDETGLGFDISAAGGTIYLLAPDRRRVIDAVRFGGQARGVSSGRWPDGAVAISELSSATPGAANRSPLARPVVINEIMYHPPSNDADTEYVELHNRSASPVGVDGWRFVAGIEFTLPAHTILPGGYLVVARNPARLIAERGLNSSVVLGPFAGALANDGERLALAMPEVTRSTNAFGAVSVSTNLVLVDEVTYGTGGRWGRWSDGHGSSLELLDPRGDNRLAANWADSDDTAESTWTTLEHTGVLDHGTGPADALQILAQGPAEFLVDEVEVFVAGGPNLIANGGFENGLTGWTFDGTHVASSLVEGAGFAGTRALHVRASARGDTGVNALRAGLARALSPGDIVTLRAKFRWLAGWPEVLLRLRGSYLEACGRLNLPANLGTPGARNSRAVANSGPAISQVTHAPILPAANQPVVVTARLDDPDGIGQALLKYRVDQAPASPAAFSPDHERALPQHLGRDSDSWALELSEAGAAAAGADSRGPVPDGVWPSALWVSVPLRDDGMDGDALAGDGWFSATIPPQPGGTLVAFHLVAGDLAPSPATGAFPEDAPARECLVRFGETTPPGRLPTYRLWMTKATFDRWTRRHKLDNHPLDLTFVHGDERVIYNVGGLFSGSPHIAPGYTTPAGALCGYMLQFPKDDRLLGATEVVLDWPGRDRSGVLEPAVYWMAEQMDLPYSHRRFIRLHVNGVTETERGSIYEDVQQINRRYIEAFAPAAPHGELFKIEQWFEFTPTGSHTGWVVPTLQNFVTTGGVKKLARYRWNWLKRAVRDSANAYQSLFDLVDAFNTQPAGIYAAQLEAVIDAEQWLRVFAFEHIVNNFDAYGHLIGKNMYAYKPPGGRWQLHMYDLDWLLHISERLPPSFHVPLLEAEDPTIRRLYLHPQFQRAYWRAVRDALHGPLAGLAVNDYIDAQYAALVANGVTWSAGQNLAPPTEGKDFLRRQRDFLAAQLAPFTGPFGITSHGGHDFASDQNLVRLQGTAPVEVKTLHVNGRPQPVEWTSVTNWSVTLALAAGPNRLVLQGYDHRHRPLPTAAASITVTVNSPLDPPDGRLVINEIFAPPDRPQASFIELHNTSLTTAFDLEGWRLDGLGFRFDHSTVIAPGGFAVLAKDRLALNRAFDATIPVAAQFTNDLDPRGETLRLVRPGPTPALDVAIDEVAFSSAPPWPSGRQAEGASLQLIDPLQDNSRAANWSVESPAPNASPPPWRFVSATGVASGSRLFIYLNSPGEVHLDDLKLVPGSVAEAGSSVLRNGDFEGDWPGPWQISPNLAASTVSDTVRHSGKRSLRVVATQAGATLDSSIWQDTDPVRTNELYTLSFWFLPSTRGSVLTIRMPFNMRLPFYGILVHQALQPAVAAIPRATPGAPNSVRATLAALPALWLNELLPDNRSGIADRLGNRGPWVELFNSGPAPIDLNAFFLSDDYAALTKWRFPTGATIGPGQFLLVWLDGAASETTAGELHTEFRLAPGPGSLALATELNGRPTLVDHLNYSTLPPDHSLGAFPDGQATRRQVFVTPTPADRNTRSSAPGRVFINEWMADNETFLADAAGEFDDWLELHNPNDFAVDLTGCALTDDPDTAGAWSFPTGTTIPARGFLLVWADRQPDQTTPDGELHANFRLNQAGDAILLLAPDGRTKVDEVRFGPQRANLSEGRWPDGANAIFALSAPTPEAPNAPPPGAGIIRITDVTAADGQVQLTWATQPGLVYRVEFRRDLIAGSWQRLADLAATGALTSLVDAVGPDSQRFYRIRWLP